MITTKEAILLFTVLLDVEVIAIDFRVSEDDFEVYISAGQGKFSYICANQVDSILQVSRAANRDIKRYFEVKTRGLVGI